jgi:hypothetical protein
MHGLFTIIIIIIITGHSVVQLIESLKVAVSNSAEGIILFSLANLCSSIMALGSTQRLIEVNTRNLAGGGGGGVKRGWHHSRLCRKCGNHDFSQPYGPWAC